MNRFHARCVMLLSLAASGAANAAPVTTHPRLWVTQQDLPRLRAWAVPSNPMWSQGLGNAVAGAVAAYDGKFFPKASNAGLPNGNLDTAAVAASPFPDHGTTNWESYATEAYAEIFAFASLVDPDSSARHAHACRARNLLMYVCREASKPVDDNAPFRSHQFATYNLANYWGEAWGVTFDWLQAASPAVLSASDKALTRTVFLQWIGACMSASTAGNEHPQPAGVVNSPQLLANKSQLRWAANNYFTGHMRDMALMALGIDAGDDPADQSTVIGGVAYPTLRSYIDNVTGAWLYQQFAVYADADTVAAVYHVPAQGMGFAAGGMSVEGFMYGHALGYLLEALLALHTAGYHDDAISGPQIHLLDGHYWNDFVDGFLASLAPAGQVQQQSSYLGPLFQFATYGDLLRFYLTYYDFTDMWGALGTFDFLTGNSERLAKARWIVSHCLSDKYPQRYGSQGVWGNSLATTSIEAFLLFDPAVDPLAIPDPRPAMPTHFLSGPLTRVLARTDWSTDQRWLAFKSCGATINHQNGDAGSFEFYRRGEWLTKQRAGYGFMTPDYLNTLGLQNKVSVPGYMQPANLAWFLPLVWQRGGQPNNGTNGGDATGMASFGDSYVYCFGDMTKMYNWPNQWTPKDDASDITHASRSLLWLKPDKIVIYDRAESKSAGLFKRLHLTLTAPAAIDGNHASVKTPGGQHLLITSLLPPTAALSATPVEPASALPSGVSIAEGEMTTTRFMIDDTAMPSRTRFLTVLTASDEIAVPDETLLNSTDGDAFQGVYLEAERDAVMFPVSATAVFTTTTFFVPSLTDVYVTGLVSGAWYDVVREGTANGMLVTVRAGRQFQADTAGVVFAPLYASAIAGGVERTPGEPILEQNAPNPCAGETMIVYELPSAQHVSIGVRDVLGRTVASFVDARQSAGRHVLGVSTAQLTTGVYFYTLITGNGERTRTMSVMK